MFGTEYDRLVPGKEATSVDNASQNVLRRVYRRAEGGEDRQRGAMDRNLQSLPVADSTLKVSSRRCVRAEDREVGAGWALNFGCTSVSWGVNGYLLVEEMMVYLSISASNLSMF